MSLPDLAPHLNRSPRIPWPGACCLCALALSLILGPVGAQQFELVTDLAPGTEQDDIVFTPSSLGTGTLNGGLAFFRGCTEVHGCEPWISDGTALGTQMLLHVAPGPDFGMITRGGFVPFGGLVYFFGRDLRGVDQLWRTDGTAAGTEVLVERVGSTSALRAEMGLLWFVGWDATHGAEPWTSDGTLAGTGLLADLEPGQEGSDAGFFRAAGGLVFFNATTSTSGRELWATNGSEAGTYQVADIEPGAESSDPLGLFPLGSQLLFTAFETSSGRELWRTDGTGPGTQRLDIRTGPDSASPTLLGEVAPGVVLMSAEDGVTGRELWRTNGTLAEPVVDLRIGPSSGIATGSESVVFGGFLYFQGNDGSSGDELFRSDGTAMGTTLVADIRMDSPSSDPEQFVAVGNQLFFSADDGTSGRELWRTNLAGTVTEQVADLDGGSASSLDNSTTGFPGPGGTLLFLGELDPLGWELWRTDGTSSGTQRLTDVVQPVSSNPLSIVAWQTGVAFRPAGGPDLGELVTTDGTEVGTAIHDFPLGEFPANNSLTEWNGDLYLASESDDLQLTRLWSWDGTDETLIAEDTVDRRLTLTPTPAGVVFDMLGELSLTDGTVVGDFSLLELASSPSGVTSEWFDDSFVWYFAADGLWRTDLANDLSELIVEPLTDEEIFFYELLGGADGFVYFTTRRIVDNDVEETFVWATDGTAAGSEIVLTLPQSIGPVSNALHRTAGRTLLLTEVFLDTTWQLHELEDSATPASFITNGTGDLLGSGLSNDDWLVLATDGGPLWRSDGTASGTQVVPSTDAFFTLVTLDDWFLVRGPQHERGVELGLLDPASGLLVELPEIEPGPAGTRLVRTEIFDDTLWASAFRSDVGTELFRLDLAPFLFDPATILFVDGFESGDSLAWSSTTP